jgi:dsDNA-specific endonuclease/ATPase MutS2
MIEAKLARRKPNNKIEYDFHGLRVADIALRLDSILVKHSKYNETIHVVHGKGSGALAAEVERCARCDPRVLDFYRSGVNEGVTILSLKSASGRPVIPQVSTAPKNYSVPPIRGSKRK